MCTHTHTHTLCICLKETHNFTIGQRNENLAEMRTMTARRVIEGKPTHGDGTQKYSNRIILCPITWNWATYTKTGDRIAKPYSGSRRQKKERNIENIQPTTVFQAILCVCV